MSKIFCKLPKILFENDELNGLSAEAKLLYALMLDRLSLSKKNGWNDKKGDCFIIFALSEMQRVLGCGHDKAIKTVKELVSAGLICKLHLGMNKPNLYYVNSVI